MFVTVSLIVVTEYYTATRFKPVKDIAKASETGPATNIIAGIAVGLQSTAIPLLVICIGILASYSIGLFAFATADPVLGIYGIAIAAVSMLSTAGMIVTLDTYGPIPDNGGGIAGRRPPLLPHHPPPRPRRPPPWGPPAVPLRVLPDERGRPRGLRRRERGP